MSTSRPPRLSRWLLERITHPDDRRFVLADLEEGYERRMRTSGQRPARRWYRVQALRSLPPALRSRWLRRSRAALSNRLADVRFALRSAARSPVITLVIVVSLAVGMAAATTVFTFANALLLRPSAGGLPEADRLVAVFTSDWDGNRWGNSSFPDYEEIVGQASTIDRLAAHRIGIHRLGDPETGRRVFGEIVSGNYFDVLGISLETGRGFRPDETRVGSAERIVVVSPRVWRQELGGLPDPVGATLRIDGEPFTVVGVAPADLLGRSLAMRVDVWVPLGIPGGIFQADEEELTGRSQRNYGLVGRLADGATLEDAQAELDLIGNRLATAHPETWKDGQGRDRALSVLEESAARVPPDAFPALASAVTVILLGTALLLALACSNVASVLLARAGRRSREIGVRLALGASRRRIVSLLLTESLLLGLAAAALALVLTHVWIGWFDAIPLPVGDLVIQLALPLDVRVLVFALLLSVGVSATFGLVPARAAIRRDTATGLHLGPRSGGTRGGSLLRRSLVVIQVAAALSFVVGAGAAYRSFDELVSMDWGVETEGVAVMSKVVPEELDHEERITAYEEVLARMRAHPDVADAALARTVEGGSFLIQARSRIRRPGEETEGGRFFRYNAISPSYMDLMGIRIVEGRSLDPTDRGETSRVAVITEGMARRLWPGETALGRRFLLGVSDAEVEVVGVAADGRYEGYGGTDTPFFWIPLYQNPADRVMVVVRSRTSAEAVLPALREELRRGEEEMAGVTPRTYDELLSYQFAFLALLGRMLGWGGAFGSLLATLGLYGVVAYAVTRRTRELALRQAVGALPRQVVRVVLGQGLRLVAAGIAIGLLVVVPVSVLLRAQIRGIPAIEPVSTVVGAVAILAITTAAAMIPARRVTRIDPARALRED